MKKYILYVFVIGVLATSCQKKTVIQGKIENYNASQKDSIECKFYHSHYASGLNAIYSTINNDGYFTFDLEIEEVRNIRLKYKNIEKDLFIEPNTTLDILFSQNKSITEYKLETNNLNNFVHRNLSQHTYKLYDAIGKENNNLNSLLHYNDSIKKTLYKEIASINSLSSITKKYLESEINYYYDNLVLYACMESRYNSSPEIFEEYKNYAENLIINKLECNVNTNKLIQYNRFIFYSNRFFSMNLYIQNDTTFLLKHGGFNSMKEYKEKVNHDKGENLRTLIIAKGKFKGEHQKKIIENRIYQSIEFFDYENLITLYEHYKNNYSDSKNLKDITIKMQPIIAFNNVKSMNIKGAYIYPEENEFTKLQDILVLPEFKNKIVLIDIWGSWCGPCIEEFQYTEKIKTKLKNEDIAYLYIANQKSYAIKNWRERIAFHNLKGYHLLGNKELIRDFFKNAGIPGYQIYPTFMIIDKNGQVAVPRAADPSEGDKLYKQLLEVLNS